MARKLRSINARPDEHAPHNDHIEDLASLIDAREIEPLLAALDSAGHGDLGRRLRALDCHWDGQMRAPAVTDALMSASEASLEALVATAGQGFSRSHHCTLRTHARAALAARTVAA